MSDPIKVKFPLPLALIEDEPSQLSLYRRFLEKNDKIKVYAYADPHEALQLLQENKFRIVITDFAMPEVSGEDIVKAASAQANGIESIVMSASIEPQEAYSCLKYGARAVLYKPVTQKKLDSLMKICINKFEEWNENIDKIKDANKTA